MPTTRRPRARLMPLTPRVLRPIGSGLGFVEADGHAVARAQQHLVARLRQGHVDQRVAFVEADADDAAAAWAGCSRPAASSSPGRGASP